MMRRCHSVLGLAPALGLLLLAPLARAQALPDYSGTWVAGRTELVTRQDRSPGGWGNMLAGLGQRRDYRLTVGQTTSAITLRFPSNSFLNVLPCRLDQAVATDVQDLGDYWRKTITTAQWADRALILGSRTLVGWWKDARPEDVRRQDTELSTIQALRLERGGSELVMDTTVADEKGTATYRTVFSRAAQ